MTKFVKVQSQESKKNKTTHWQNKKVLRCCFLCVVCVKHGVNVNILVDCLKLITACIPANTCELFFFLDIYRQFACFLGQEASGAGGRK